MFAGNDLLISEIRYQSIRLGEIAQRLETDHSGRVNTNYYSNALQGIERALRKIRNRAFENSDKFIG